LLVLPASRRSELVGLALDDARSDPNGFVLTIRKSKTDQNAEGHQLAIPYGSSLRTCPVRSPQAWLDVLKASGITSGPVFRGMDQRGDIREMRLTERIVASVVKRYAEKAASIRLSSAAIRCVRTSRRLPPAAALPSRYHAPDS
jgi:hypothetical protein